MPEPIRRTADAIVNGNNFGHRPIQMWDSAGLARFKACRVTNSIAIPANNPTVAIMCANKPSE